MQVLAYFAADYGLSISDTMLLLCAVNAVLIFVMLKNPPRESNTIGLALLVSLAVIVNIHWVQDPPRSHTAIKVVLPALDNSYESVFFEKYEETLNYVGVRATQVDDLEEIAEGDLVIMPWVTSEEFEGFEFRDLVSELRAKKCIVLAFGEHTNFRGVMDRLNHLELGIKLRNDTTVSEGNTDFLGNVRSSSILMTSPESLINRGASIRIESLWAKALLVGDTWHGDVATGDLTWIGDLRPDSWDIKGKITLMASYSDGARWIFVADNSSVLNRLMIADPSTIKSLIFLSSLWPIFLNDLFFLVAGLLLFVVSISKKFKVVASVSFFTMAILGFSTAITYANSSRTLASPSSLNSMNGFNPKSYSLALIALLEKFRSNDVEVYHHTVSLNDVEFGESNASHEIHFGIIDSDSLHVADEFLDECLRVGNIYLSSAEVNLKNAQVCQYSGKASSVVLGTKSAAAGISVPLGSKIITIVLDDKFLSNESADVQNLRWVEEEILTRSK